MSGLECRETLPGRQTTHFVWLTDLRVTKDNFRTVAQGGRWRWKIENEGYNMQKNGGYELEHAYSHNTWGIKNFYLLLQIAHLIVAAG